MENKCIFGFLAIFCFHQKVVLILMKFCIQTRFVNCEYKILNFLRARGRERQEIYPTPGYPKPVGVRDNKFNMRPGMQKRRA